MEPKYKVGDMLQYYYYDGTIGNLRVEWVRFDNQMLEYVYCQGEKHCCFALPESNVIGFVPYNEEEYQLYLKLKEKYE